MSYERRVASPDGKHWLVRKVWYRWGGADPIPAEGFEADIRHEVADFPYGAFVFAISDGAWRLVGPFFEAAFGRRPWVAAICEEANVTMVWRATGRRRANEIVDEVADDLLHGHDRPTPLDAYWVGYDRGGIRLPSKS